MFTPFGQLIREAFNLKAYHRKTRREVKRLAKAQDSYKLGQLLAQIYLDQKIEISIYTAMVSKIYYFGEPEHSSMSWWENQLDEITRGMRTIFESDKKSEEVSFIRFMLEVDYKVIIWSQPGPLIHLPTRPWKERFMRFIAGV